jgi:hypothetical protein
MAGLRPDGAALRLLLESQEVEVLASLAEGLVERVSAAQAGATQDPVIDRFAPHVSRGDRELDAELRAMLRGELLSDRETRLAAFAVDIRSWSDDASGTLDRRLDRDDAMRIVEVLNDIRLALAATIGFDEDLRQALEDDDPRHDAIVLMDALAWLQGGLIEFIDGDA